MSISSRMVCLPQQWVPILVLWYCVYVDSYSSKEGLTLITFAILNTENSGHWRTWSIQKWGVQSKEWVSVCFCTQLCSVFSCNVGQSQMSRPQTSSGVYIASSVLRALFREAARTSLPPWNLWTLHEVWEHGKTLESHLSKFHLVMLLQAFQPSTFAPSWQFL